METLEVKTVAGVIVDLVRDLLLLLDKYKKSFQSDIKKGTRLRENLLEKILSLIENVNLS